MELYRNMVSGYGTFIEHLVAREAFMAAAQFKGVSGRVHRFTAHHPEDAFAAAPAVYAFARPGFGGKGWVILFLSRTANLQGRLKTHERWEEARLLGATHILVHEREERDVREYVEADLVGCLKPVLNGAVIETPAVEAESPALGSRAKLTLVWAA
jgi:hypothetical protein